jgi:hypothetical protein
LTLYSTDAQVQDRHDLQHRAAQARHLADNQHVFRFHAPQDRFQFPLLLGFDPAYFFHLPLLNGQASGLGETDDFIALILDQLLLCAHS